MRAPAIVLQVRRNGDSSKQSSRQRGKHEMHSRSVLHTKVLTALRMTNRHRAGTNSGMRVFGWAGRATLQSHHIPRITVALDSGGWNVTVGGIREHCPDIHAAIRFAEMAYSLP